jgi:putative selenium metabolism protein SsnA
MLITNGKIITWEKENRIVEDHAIYIEHGLIQDVGLETELLAHYPETPILDAKGQYVMPGNICAHTHLYGAFARGMGIPGTAPKDFPEILKKLWWPLDMALDESAVRLSAQVMLVDAIKHGTTTLIDHHASPNFIDGSLDVIAEAVIQAGVRASLSYEVTDRNGPEGAKAGIRENIRFLRERVISDDNKKVRKHPLLSGCFGLHASLTISDETLENCAAVLPSGFGVHIHVAEHPVDQYDSINKSSLRVVDRLEKSGLLGPRSIAVHAVHVDVKEMTILADTDTWVTHQPRSNMNNAVGISQVEDMLRLGIPVCIGTDGFSSTMWDEWKFTYLVHKLWHRDPRRMNGSDVIQMGVYNNAALAKVFFPEAPLGIIEPGAYADLIFVDYHPFTPMSPGNLPWQILFGFNESMITSTIVGGKVLMMDRELLTLDEEQISSEARSLVPSIWAKYETMIGGYE